MIYLGLCAVSALLFVIFAGAAAAKKGKRAVWIVFALIFLAGAVFGAAAYYTGFGVAAAKPKEISEYCGESINEFINATKLNFKNTSEDIFDADGVSVCQRNEKIIYVDLKSEKYMIHGFNGKFSKNNTFYKGKQTSLTLNEILSEQNFSEFSVRFAETEFTNINSSDICVYDAKGRTLVFSFDDSGNGTNIRYFPDPKFAETVVNSTVSFSENAAEFLAETEKLNLIEKEQAYEDEFGKRILWQLKTVEISDDFILAEKNGTEFKIYPMPQYLSKSALPEKGEYIEVTGLFYGYEDAWTVKNAIVAKNISAVQEDITGIYKNKSGEIAIEDENGKLHLTGTSNYGAYTVDGYVEKINDTTYFYDGSEGDFYITPTDGGIDITTDTLKSFEGMYTKEN